LIWKGSACVGAIKFLDSDKYGKEYKYDVFVGSSVKNLYHFDLNKDNTALTVAGPLKDKVVDTSNQGNNQIIFGKGFGGITDMKVSPYGGLLYLVSHRNGTICKIVPND
jgi:glucose/arabinose dehydrogenase